MFGLSVAERQIRSLSERNESRAALRDYARNMTGILENTTDGFLALDSDWKFIYVNPKAASLLDCSRDELVRRRFLDKISEGLRFAFRRRLPQENGGRATRSNLRRVI